MVDALLEKKEESFFQLADFVMSKKSWNTTSVHPWAVFCALSILAKMDSYRAFLAITSTMIEYSDYAYDWLLCDAPGVLAHTGRDFVKHLNALVENDNIDIHVRNGAEIALLVIALKNKKMRQQITESIKQSAMNTQDMEKRDNILGHLFHLNDKKINNYINDLVKSGRATEGCYEVLECIELFDFGESDIERFKRQSMDQMYFFRENANCTPPSMRQKKYR